MAPALSTGSELIQGNLTGRILKCAFDVHRALGPGLLESAYRACLVRELQVAGLIVKEESPVSLIYKGVAIDCGYRSDIIVEDQVLLELKSVDRLLPIHEAQLLTYLKLTRLPVGFLMNFNTVHLRAGLRRLVL